MADEIKPAGPEERLKAIEKRLEHERTVFADPRFRAVHIDPESGMLSDQAWRLLPPHPFCSIATVAGLDDFREKCGREARTAILRLLEGIARCVAMDRGLDLCLSHRYTDHYFAQHSHEETLTTFWDEVSRCLEKHATWQFIDPSEKLHSLEGVTLVRGIAAGSSEAEARLRESKASVLERLGELPIVKLSKKLSPPFRREKGFYQGYYAWEPGNTPDDTLMSIARLYVQGK